MFHPANAATPPHNLEAERTVIGALLTDPERMIDVAPLLRTGDYFDSTLAAIYAAIDRLHEDRTPIDFVTVSDALRDNQNIQAIGGSAFLAELASEVPTASHVMQYAEIVRALSLRRQLAKTGQAIAELARVENQNASELLETAEKQILRLSRKAIDASPVQLAEMAAKRYEHYAALYDAEDKSALYGITTGFTGLDQKLTGLAAGHLVIVAGRPSMGKTALALNMAAHAAEQKKTVLFCSLEMTNEQLFDRTFGGILGMEPWRLQKGAFAKEEFERMGTAIDELAEATIFFDDDPDRSLTKLRSKARRQQLQHGLDLLIVDYLQLIDVTGSAARENQVQKITYISKSLKNLARELECPVIALSQLSRAPEQRPDRRPQLSDLRESGAIEQDADSVLMLYREGYYNEDCDDPDLLDVFVRKNRHGPTGRVELRFDRQRMCFESVPLALPKTPPIAQRT